VKVLIINDYPTIVGGAERFLENLFHEAGSSAIDFHRLDIADVAKEILPVSKASFFRNRFRRIGIFSELVQSITRRIESLSPDLIHLNNNNLYTNSVLRSLQQTHIPVVSFIHDEYAMRRISSPFYLRTAHSFTFLTHSVDFYQKLNKDSRKAYLVKVPFNPTKWERTHNNDCSHVKTDLLFVGRIEKAKGIFKLINAVERVKAKIPSVKVAILGDGSELGALKQMVSAKKLTANVEIRGMQQDQVIMEYYHHTKILVFPSAIESLGYVGLEAQSCGVPVVAFENKGSSRWCMDNHSGFMVKERSAQKLADKVLEIIHDDVILTRISTTARENIRLEGYNASKHRITDIYKAVLSW
jgi:glycosyltransferase involved in cell wall biosynthesis